MSALLLSCLNPLIYIVICSVETGVAAKERKKKGDGALDGQLSTSNDLLPCLSPSTLTSLYRYLVDAI